MKRFTSYLCAATMAISTLGFGAGASAQAMPNLTQLQSQIGSSNVIEVQRRNDERRGFRDRRGPDRRDFTRDRSNRRDFERRGNEAYYRGHRGQRQARRGWRQHEGFWFPPAAFIAGAIIGGAVAQPQQPSVRPGRMSQSHVDWCFNRYRSYRTSDNTFQPYNGPRQACRSPHG